MYNDTTYNAVQAQRANLRSAMLTFVTSTLPPTVASLKAAIAAMDNGHPMLDGVSHEDLRFYAACVRYVNELIAKGRYSGAAYPYP